MTPKLQMTALRKFLFESNRWQIVSSLLVVLILGVGWYDRHQLPPLPILDADAFGYLQPALSFFHGDGLQQTSGRAVVYPSMLIAFLGPNISFEAMVQWQEFFGLLTAVALWGCWLVFWTLLPKAPARDGAACLIGVAFMGFYYWNPSVIFYEHTLRPEAMVPFFGSTQLLATGIYLLARFGRIDGRWLIPAGALAIILAYFCLALKPSWILASGASVLLVLVGWIRAGNRARPAFVGMLLGVIVSLAILVTYKVWMKPDLEESALAPDTFLAKTLLTTHADIILPALGKEVQEHRESILPIKVLREFTANFRKEMAVARADVVRYPQWSVHGVRYPFNPDYLMFTTNIAWPLKNAGMTSKQIAAFYFRCYFLAVRRFPADISRKVLNNMRLFFLPDPQTFCRQAWFENGIDGSIEEFALVAKAATPSSSSQKQIQYELKRLANFEISMPSDDGPSFRRQAYALAVQFMCVITPLVGLVFLGMAIQILAIPPFRAAFGVALLFTLFMYSVPFANALNVALVQSLPVVGRYRQMYGMFYAFSTAAMLVFLVTAYGTIIAAARKYSLSEPLK